MKKILFTMVIFAAAFAIINPWPDAKVSLQYGGRAVYPMTVTNGTSDWLLIPESTTMTTVSLELASNQARVEYTTVPYPALTNTSHIFVWPLGNVTNRQVDALIGDVIAIRVVALTNVVQAYFVFKRTLP